MNKLQCAEQLRKALQMFAQSLSDDEAMEVATVYPAWQTSTAYRLNEMVTYGENEVGDPQLSNWTPDITPALWTPIGLAPDNIPIWSQPTGAHDAYNTGDKVHYPDKDGPVYQSLIDGNIYSPEAYPAGWELVE